MGSYKLSELSIGMTAERSKTVTEEDIKMFASVSTDENPVHLDADYAASTPFKQKIAHGMLSCGLISAVLGNELPGHGSIYVSQNINFTKPVFINDTITAKVKIIEIIADKKRVKLHTSCHNQNDEVVCEGEAVIAPRRR